MEGKTTQHPTGFVCRVCDGIAVADVDGEYLCAMHAIEAMTTIEIDLRAEEDLRIEHGAATAPAS
ncbi:MAG: hypothetical protein MUP13_09675 [Thermoanaerobaculales bacterium]|nr:hypothetical protein [Thermoanaerobaculales bacterium]